MSTMDLWEELDQERTRLLNMAAAHKSKIGCLMCRNTVSKELTYHHRNRAEKSGTVMEIVHRTYDEDKMWAEIAKCDVLCNKCHTELHKKEQTDAVEPTSDVDIRKE